MGDLIMKKTVLFAFAAAAAAFVVASCDKTSLVETPVTPEQEETDPKTPEEPKEGVPEGMVRLTFGVTAEGEGTKTQWNGTTHSWSDGDQIRIIWGAGDSDYVDAAVVDGKVTATVGQADNYYAVYPTTAAYALDASAGSITITIPRYQTGKFEDADIMAAKTSAADLKLGFKNMVSMIKFTTGSAYSYNSVSFMANDQTKLTGTVSTAFPASFDVTTANGSESIVCIQKGNPSGNEGVSAGGTYYLAILPGASIDNGIGFKIEQRDSSTDLLGGGISKSSFARDRAKIYDMGTLDSRIVKDWYISESGTGTGTSSADPAGPERLMDLLNPAYSTNNTTAGWRLTGATIHVLPGTYNLQALNGGEVFAPHYNLSNFAAHLKGEGTATNPAKFICNQTDVTDRIFSISGSNRVGKFTFENITFAANGASLAPGIAFDFDSSEKSEVSFKDCVFTGFVQEGTINGGPVYVHGNGAADISFTGCTFSNNSCNTGGAVYIYNENANVIFDNCLFDSNSAVNYAGALRARSFASLVINGGSFENNTSNNKGGAIYLDAGALSITGTSFINNKSVGNRAGAILLASTSESSITDATFTSNSASNGGAVHTEAGTVNITNTSFSKNSATNGGAVRSSGAVVLNIDNSSFEENTATNGGGLAFEYDAAAAVNVNNTIFRANSNSAILNKGAMKVVGCVFENNSTEDKGSAIYSNGANGKIAIAKIFNSQFEGNESTPTDGSGSSMKGCTVITGSYSYALVANSTFSGNIEHSKSHGVISPGTSTNTKVYVVSSTLSENLFNDGSSTSAGPDFARTTTYLLVYNTISTNTVATIANVVVQNSIFTLRRFNESRTSFEDLSAFALGTYSNGVYPLNTTYYDAYNMGMTVADLQALTYDGNIPLTDEEKALLAKDQKGNSRTGTIMGAYVGN